MVRWYIVGLLPIVGRKTIDRSIDEDEPRIFCDIAKSMDERRTHGWFAVAPSGVVRLR